jgi:hypothetical protein
VSDILGFIIYAVFEFAAIAFVSFPVWVLIPLLIAKTGKNKTPINTWSKLFLLMNWSWLFGAPITYLIYLSASDKPIVFVDILFNGIVGAAVCWLGSFVVIRIANEILGSIVRGINKWAANHFEVKKPLRNVLNDEYALKFIILYAASGLFVYVAMFRIWG